MNRKSLPCQRYMNKSCFENSDLLQIALEMLWRGDKSSFERLTHSVTGRSTVSSNVKLSLLGTGLVLALAGSTAQAAPMRPPATAQDGLVQQVQEIYVDGYNHHRHHHGHVHGNPHRRHLDCQWHGNHEHCQVHNPRRHHHHHHHGSGHYHYQPGYEYGYQSGYQYGPSYRYGYGY